MKYKVISILKLNDKEWAKYYTLHEKIDDAQHVDITASASKIAEFRKKRLCDYELNKDRSQEEKVIFDGDTAIIGWVAYRLDRQGSSFSFNIIYSPIPPEFIKFIFKIIYDFINENGEDASYFWKIGRAHV